MGNSPHADIVQLLLVGFGMLVGRWMRFFPKDFLTWIGLGSETGHLWLLKMVKGFGIMMFFGCANGFLLVGLLLVGADPFNPRSQWSLITIVIAIGMSVFVLKKPRKVPSSDFSAPGGNDPIRPK